MIAAQSTDMPHPNVTAIFPYFGQLLDHDITLTATPRSFPCTQSGESFNIAVPPGDPVFDPFHTGSQNMLFSRTDFCTINNVRQHFNGVTPFVDCSMVYGSSSTVASALRAFTGGRMVVGASNLLPDAIDIGLLNFYQQCVLGFTCFATGETRCNENPILTTLHTILLREHNRIALTLQTATPSLTDEVLYQEARRRVIAEWQAIVYYEWLPLLLGDSCPPLTHYTAFNSSLTPNLSIEFATVGYRFGHSMTPDTIVTR